MGVLKAKVAGNWETVGGGSAASTGLSTDPADAVIYSRNTAGSGWFYELMSGAQRVWARSRIDGRPTLKGIAMRQTLDWYYGDPDPTANGALPSWVHVRAHLDDVQTVPAWVLAIAGAEVIRTVPPTVTYVVTWSGAGLADESALAAGTFGTGDTLITALFNANAPTVETGELITPAVEFAATAAQVGLYWTIAAGITRRVGFWLKTPATFAAQRIMRLRSGASTEAISLGISTNGVMQVFNSGNAASFSTPSSTLAASTWYWVELGVTQNATTAVNGTYQMKIWNTSAAVVYDTGAAAVDTAGTPVGFGTTHDRVYFGVLTSATMTLFMADFRVTDDAVTTIGAV